MKQMFLVTVLLCLFCGISSAQENEPGLGGIKFDDPDFTRPDENNVLDTCENDWGDDWDDNFSVRWQGFIEGPTTGEVTFTGTATDGMTLKVGEAVVIDGLESGGGTGKVTMEKGKKAPVVVELSVAEGNSALHLKWSYEGQEEVAVPDSAMSHDPSQIPEFEKEEDEDEDEEEEEEEEEEEADDGGGEV